MNELLSLVALPTFLPSFVSYVYFSFVFIMSTFLACLQILGFLFIFKNKAVEKLVGPLVYMNGDCQLVGITKGAVNKLAY